MAARYTPVEVVTVDDGKLKIYPKSYESFTISFQNADYKITALSPDNISKILNGVGKVDQSKVMVIGLAFETIVRVIILSTIESVQNYWVFFNIQLLRTMGQKLSKYLAQFATLINLDLEKVFHL